MGLAQLSTALWRESDLLELVLCRLDGQPLLPAAGMPRWMPHARHDVGPVRAAIGEVGLARAIEAEALARDLGVPADTCLRELADVAPAPWRDILAEHRGRLVALCHEVATSAFGVTARLVQPSLLDFLR